MKVFVRLTNRFQNSSVLQALCHGLIMNIPLLTIGSMALIFLHLPIEAYQAFISGFGGGCLRSLFQWVNQATFGILGLTSTVSISFCYAQLKTNHTGTILANVFAAVSASFIFNGFFTEGFDVAALGPQGMCNSIFSAMAASYLFFRLIDSNFFQTRLYTVGADYNFNNVLSATIPVFLTVTAAYLFNQVLRIGFGVTGFEALLQKGIANLFGILPSSTVRTLLYIILTGLLWFFGIHGTNVLNSVDYAIFPGGVEAATDAIITKPFVDTFVFMGGSGTTICLLLAILFFSRKKTNRRLARLAALPILFNVNELLLYGMPIVLNTYLLLPFMITPLLSTATSYFAIWIGLVPQPVRIHWVTPLLAGGYAATGTFAGVALQLVNILLGTLVYRWFLLRYERATDRMITDEVGKLIEQMQQAEESGLHVNLLKDIRGKEGIVARMLAEDLHYVLAQKDEILLHYQPQFDNQNRCVGAEALLRWDHPRCGMVYPPLLVGLAKDRGLLPELEQYVLTRACADIRGMLREGVCPPTVSVNVTAITLQSPTFPAFLQTLFRSFPEVRGILCLELTEQMSFLMGESAYQQLQEMRELGVTFAVDDFSMGHTSLKYLQTDLFDMVKLDGSLVRDLLKNDRNREIIFSILRMSQSLGFTVLAEYVETVEQKELLESLGCNYYQGYLYSPALPYDACIAFLRSAQPGGVNRLPSAFPQQREERVV